MKSNELKRLARVVVSIVAAMLIAGCAGDPREEDATFSHRSDDLKSTAIVATLEAPIQPDANAIWCGSMVACWKTMADEIIKAAPEVEGAPAIATRLNAARDSRKDIKPEHLYTAAGWIEDDIVTTINDGLREKFPTKAAPVFPALDPRGFISYAYLEVTMTFGEPYFRTKLPLGFTDAAGEITPLASFGISPSDDSNRELSGQPMILHCDQDVETGVMKSFIVDLDRKSDTQLVVAAVAPGATLSETLASVEAKIAAGETDKALITYLQGFDTLLVPDMDWRIIHRFKELEGKALLNPAMKAKEMAFELVQQDTKFRLDRRGAELKSEAMIYDTAACAPSGPEPLPRRFVFDRPFLLYMKTRGAAKPYFVMWVANGELLNKWIDGKK